MENELTDIHSPHIIGFDKQIKILKDVADQAQELIDYESAHNPEILRAIDIVERFLRKTHRLCYGGQAINAHLPKNYKIYDPTKALPDYDFFTPSTKKDLKTLIEMFKTAGYVEISAREGMHEGTIKIYINYIPVADITEIDSKLYSILSKKEFRLDGISYLDSNTLRMMMYLELSRPKGEVERWEKVYQRLLVFNQFVPTYTGASCHSSLAKSSGKTGLTDREIAIIMHFVIDEKRVFAGADLAGFYKTSLKIRHQKAKWLLYTKKPIYIYTSHLEEDMKHFKYELKHNMPQGGSLHISKINPLGGDLIPAMYVFSKAKKGMPFLVLMNETACHSYYSVPISGTVQRSTTPSAHEHTREHIREHIREHKHQQISGKQLRIASLDTLITLYFSLSLLKYRFLDLGSLECLADELISISTKARESPDKFPFPFISIECSGHQKHLSSLIREKVKRIKNTRKNTEEIQSHYRQHPQAHSQAHPQGHPQGHPRPRPRPRLHKSTLKKKA